MKDTLTSQANFIEKIIKPEVRQLKRVKYSADDRFDFLRLDRKERLVPFDERLLNKFKESITFEDLSAYDELGPTYRKLANYLGVKEEQVYLTAGSDLGFKTIYDACLEKGDNVILHAPCYAMGYIYAEMFGIEPRMVPVKKDNWQVDYEGMLKIIDDKTKMLVIENPNGFVGTKPEEKDLEMMAAELLERNILFLIDEAYFYIEHDKCKTHLLIEKYPNVIITQTFSKAHGLAGLRVGYLIGEAKLIDAISKVKPLHEISSLAARATEWIIDHPELLEENRKILKDSKQFLLTELKKIGVEAKNSHANFIMVYLPDEGKTKNIADQLREKGILIRRPFSEPFLKGWILICVGTREHSKMFLQALTEITA